MRKEISHDMNTNCHFYAQNDKWTGIMKLFYCPVDQNLEIATKIHPTFTNLLAVSQGSHKLLINQRNSLA